MFSFWSTFPSLEIFTWMSCFPIFLFSFTPLEKTHSILNTSCFSSSIMNSHTISSFRNIIWFIVHLIISSINKSCKRIRCIHIYITTCFHRILWHHFLLFLFLILISLITHEYIHKFWITRFLYKIIKFFSCSFGRLSFKKRNPFLLFSYIFIKIIHSTTFP